MPEEPSSGTEFAASQESKLVLQSRGGNAAGEDEDGDGEQGDGAERGDHDGLLSAGLACTKICFHPLEGDPENKKSAKEPLAP